MVGGWLQSLRVPIARAGVRGIRDQPFETAVALRNSIASAAPVVPARVAAVAASRRSAAQAPPSPRRRVPGPGPAPARSSAWALSGAMIARIYQLDEVSPRAAPTSSDLVVLILLTNRFDAIAAKSGDRDPIRAARGRQRARTSSRWYSSMYIADRGPQGMPRSRVPAGSARPYASTAKAPVARGSSMRIRAERASR